jgi:hypothetical protein
LPVRAFLLSFVAPDACPPGSLTTSRRLFAASLALLLALLAPAAADPVADFYRGKTLTW